MAGGLSRCEDLKLAVGSATFLRIGPFSRASSPAIRSLLAYHEQGRMVAPTSTGAGYAVRRRSVAGRGRPATPRAIWKFRCEGSTRCSGTRTVHDRESSRRTRGRAAADWSTARRIIVSAPSTVWTRSRRDTSAGRSLSSSASARRGFSRVEAMRTCGPFRRPGRHVVDLSLPSGGSAPNPPTCPGHCICRELGGRRSRTYRLTVPASSRCAGSEPRRAHCSPSCRATPVAVADQSGQLERRTVRSSGPRSLVPPYPRITSATSW